MKYRELGEIARYGRVTTVLRWDKDSRGCWMAYIEDDKKRWEAGNTEVEAIGKLIISHPELTS